MARLYANLASSTGSILAEQVDGQLVFHCSTGYLYVTPTGVHDFTDFFENKVESYSFTPRFFLSGAWKKTLDSHFLLEIYKDKFTKKTTNEIVNFVTNLEQFELEAVRLILECLI